jgi:hypothetical protein
VKLTQTRHGRVFGGLTILVGLLGFFSNPIFGIFSTNTLQNLVHIVSGAIIVWAALGSELKSMSVNRTFGVVYALLAILGFAGMLDVLNVNTATNWLLAFFAFSHLSIGFGVKAQ